MLENPKRREAVEKVVNKVLRVAEGTYKVRPVEAPIADALPRQRAKALGQFSA